MKTQKNRRIGKLAEALLLLEASNKAMDTAQIEFNESLLKALRYLLELHCSTLQRLVCLVSVQSDLKAGTFQSLHAACFRWRGQLGCFQ